MKGDVYPRQQNIKNIGRNIIRRRVERKILEQKVGDPLFARYMSQFGTTIPRRYINANLKATDPTLFQGGKHKKRNTRKARKLKKRATTRK